MSLLILHLSDIHIRAASDPILKRADLIARTLNEHLATASLVVIIVSGDIAFSGSKKEYQLAKPFLEDLRKRIRKEARCDVEFVICPGNHDCDFTTNNSSRENNISAMQGGGSVDQSVINSCTRIQDEFFRFRDALETWKNTSGDKLWRTHTITIEGKRVVFDSLNVSWVSKKKEDKNLFFPVENYRSTAEGTKSDVRFITFHHPLNWFAAANYRPFRRLLRSNGSVLLSGHEHEGNVGALDESESGQSIYVEALVLQEGTNLESTGFSILHVDLAEMELTHHRLNYNKDEYSEDASGARRIKIPSANSEMLAVQPDFRRMLDDAGAISRPESPVPLTLQDIYVFPDLRKLHQRTRSRKFLDSRILLQPVNTEGGVILECEERLGSTSLLYQIYSAYLNQGFAPVLLRGSDIKRKDTGHLDSLIDSAIKQQYLEKDRNFVAQRTRAEKILLIDDLDDSKVKDASSRSQILCHYNKRFDHLVVTTPKNFELEEIIESTTTDDLANLTHYEIQPLGYTKRSELVKRWVSVGSQGLDSSQYISECDKAERLISAAMHKSLIPSAPLYLLTLLQSIW